MPLKVSFSVNYLAFYIFNNCYCSFRYVEKFKSSLLLSDTNETWKLVLEKIFLTFPFILGLSNDIKERSSKDVVDIILELAGCGIFDIADLLLGDMVKATEIVLPSVLFRMYGYRSRCAYSSSSTDSFNDIKRN